MKHPRTLALVAAALLLYLLASAGALGVGLSPGVLAVSLVALWAALGVPLWLTRLPSGDEAPRLVSFMGSLLGLCLAAWLAMDARGLLGELCLALTLPPVGLLGLRLAFAWPDVPPRLTRHLYAERLVRWVGGFAALLGMCAALPPVWVGERALIAPPDYAFAPLAFALACLVVATGLRANRRRLGSGTRALSENLWPLLGSCAALGFLGCAALLHLVGWDQSLWLRGSLAGAAALFLLGHVWLLAPSRVRGASGWAREAFAVVAALALVLVSVHVLSLVLPAGEAARFDLEPPLFVWVAAGLLGFALLRRALRAFARLMFAPQRGVLLEAVTRIEAELGGAHSYPELAARSLRYLRRASGSPEAAPLLFSFAPLAEIRLDAAGQPRRSERSLPSPVLQQLTSAPGEPIVRDDLRARLVRRPELRELVSALDELDAACVIPLVLDADLTGALVLARGLRSDPLTMEELDALSGLTRLLAPIAEQFLATERAMVRADETATQRDAYRGQLEEAREELARLHAEANLLKAGHTPGPASPIVQYSAAMQELVTRLDALAAQDIPIMLVGEQGVPLLPYADRVRFALGRGDKPLVLADCAAPADGEQARALFGGGGAGVATRPGWLELAADGVLLLMDLVALDLDTQVELARALSEKRALPVDAPGGAYPITARILVSVRQPLAVLAESGALAPQLARWLENGALLVPPLRQRREDVESLVLLAMDRAARVLGRDVPGIAPEALRALQEYDFPGNEAELDSIMERAVLASHGPRITLEQLPPLPVGGASAGSFLDQEREILRRAMERAGGNKTRAARALGLKRTTLIDKLRRLGLEAGGRDTEH